MGIKRHCTILSMEWDAGQGLAE